MSDSIFRIWSIARYEAKVIMRGWLFRTALLLPVTFLLVIMFTRFFDSNFNGFLIQVFYNAPSTTSWMVTIFYTIYSCVILAAVATNSGWQDWRLDSLEAIRIRPWSNIEYAAAKIAGQIFCFVIMTAAVLLATLGICVFTPALIIVWPGYLLYPMLISLPAFFFISGLSMFVVRLFRNQMFSLLVVTAVILLSVLTADRFFHLFDMTSFRLPLYFSSMTGFSFPELIARHRLMYLAAGVMMVCVTVLVQSRPPGRRLTPVAVSMTSVLLLAFTLVAGTGYVSHFTTGIELRKNIREIGERIRPVPRIEPLEYHIEVDQEGKGIGCSVRMVLVNRSGSSVDRYILTLNPGLDVKEVSGGSGDVDFDREAHLLTVVPPAELRPGEKDTIMVRYSGTIERRAMYSDVPEEVRCTDVTFQDISGMMFDLASMRMIRVPRDIAPQRYDYILLVPDAMWYPVPGLPYDPQYPEDDHRFFSSFRLNVKPREGLDAVSQGRRDESGNGVFLFEAEFPLTGLTLAIGEFRERTIEVDSLQYHLYSTPVSEEIFELVGSVVDTLPALIAQIRDRFEYSLGLDYPFRRLTFLEVPASFFPFSRPMRETGSGFAQPEIYLFHEGGLTLGFGGLPAWVAMDEKYMGKKGIPPEEIRERTVVRSTSMLLSNLGTNPLYNIFPMYFRHVTAIDASSYPHLWLMFEHMAGEGVFYNLRNRRWSKDGMTDNERTSRMIQQGDFIGSVTDGRDYNLAGNLVTCWAYHHYYLIKALSDEESINEFLHDMVESNRFRSVEEGEFLRSFAEYFGFGLESIVIDMNDPTEIPGYLYGNFDCCEVIEGERKYYRAGFDVVNREGIRGVVAVSAALKYPTAVRKAMMRTIKNPVVAIEALEPGESRRLEFTLDYEPITIWINTMISRNIPSRITWGPGVEISGMCGSRPSSVSDIDLSDFSEESIVVDDQDPGFETSGGKEGGFLKRLLPSASNEREYSGISRVAKSNPSEWTVGLDEGFFGAYIRSASCIRAGTGDARAIWRTDLKEAGSYDVYCYILDPYRKSRPRSRAKMGLDRIEHHYTIHHSEGSAEVVLMPDRCEDGWNPVGRYYFEKGEAVVELSDESPVLYVIADAVKWVKKD